MIGLGGYAKKQPSQRGLLAFFDEEHEASITEANIGMMALEDGLASHLLTYLLT